MNVAPDQSLARAPKESVRARICQLDCPGLVCDHHGVRSGFQYRAKPLFRSRQLFGFAPEKLFRPPELDKHTDLTLKDLGNNGLEQKIDRPQVISTEELLVAAIGGDK